jgi:hypothetical protein
MPSQEQQAPGIPASNAKESRGGKKWRLGLQPQDDGVRFVADAIPAKVTPQCLQTNWKAAPSSETQRGCRVRCREPMPRACVRGQRSAKLQLFPRPSCRSEPEAHRNCGCGPSPPPPPPPPPLRGPDPREGRGVVVAEKTDPKIILEQCQVPNEDSRMRAERPLDSVACQSIQTVDMVVGGGGQ